ncbi:MAG: hypothetical protein WCO57_04705 [Verrucomicrobiota bacterium]
MQPQPYVRFVSPVTLCLTLPSANRPRVATPDATQDTWQEFDALPLHLHVDALARTLTAYLAPIPKGIVLYGEADFQAACADSMEDHIQQVHRFLGDDPAAALQALIDGEPLPEPPQRVPREVAHWRMEYVLEKRNLLDRLDAVIAALPAEQQELALAAWKGFSAIRRNSPLILFAAPLLDLSPAQTDEIFIACEALPA